MKCPECGHYEYQAKICSVCGERMKIVEHRKWRNERYRYDKKKVTVE